MNRGLVLFFILVIQSYSASANFNFYKDLSLVAISEEELSKKITKEIFSYKGWPDKIELDERLLDISYNLNKELEKKIKRELRRYGTAYTSVVIIDNNNGKVLAALDHTREGRKFGKNLAFASTNPAASVFKVITAADLLENTEVDTETYFTYNGKATTLYKYQLKNRKTKWTRKIPLEKAFALSNNVVFGKAAINNSSFESLTKMANKFGFNQSLLQLVNVGGSELFSRKGQYPLAEFASGFNKKTNISPLHGAVIASIVANNGLLKKPTLINQIVSRDTGKVVWEPRFELERILSEDTAKSLQEMMDLAVARGTARSAFYRRSKQLRNYEIGGKTGSITGGFPYGKRDWFVSYMKPKDGSGQGISICVMIVNVKKWYIKSTVLTKKIMDMYLDVTNG